MRFIELLESQAEQDLHAELIRAQRRCKALAKEFAQAAAVRGYDYARKSVIDSIPNVEHMGFYIGFAGTANSKLTKTYATTQLMIKQLVDRINSGV